MTVNELSFKDALSRFASGVCVVTTVRGDGVLAGLTISSFTSLSLDPPLVLFCLGCKSDALIHTARDGRFAINILAEDQEEVSEICASQVSDKFALIGHSLAETGCPTINGALAILECQVAAVHDGGDHRIVVGRVERLRVLGGRPLLRYRGRYSRIT